MKIALGIEYLGSSYHGWQKQQVSPTVQDSVEVALSEVADEKIKVFCAGRTDARVHALCQVVHFETSSFREEYSWLMGVNSKLPDNIVVNWVKNVDDDFHARFSATGRTYQYILLNRKTRAGLLNGLVTWEYHMLDVDNMRKASHDLLGKHDFTSFRAIGCQAKSPIRNIRKFKLEKLNNFIVVTISANAFLYHMVRNIMGVLIDIGKGKKEVSWAAEILAAKDRTLGGVTAKPDGLYLSNIDYPKKYFIPQSRSSLFNFINF